MPDVRTCMRIAFDAVSLDHQNAALRQFRKPMVKTSCYRHD